jgi:hypothetical protein
VGGAGEKRLRRGRGGGREGFGEGSKKIFGGMGVGGMSGIILRPVEDHCEMPSPSVHSSPSVSTVSVIETPSVPLSPRVLPRQTAGTGQFSGWQIELKITL